MPIASGSFSRDANYVPITRDGVTVSEAVTFTGNNTTVSTPLFTLTGSVVVYQLYGIVTTALGSSHTATHWRLNDQTAQPVISLVTGTSASSFAVGSVLARTSLVGVALSAKNSSAGGVLDPIAATVPDMLMPVILVQKTGGVLTQLEYTYTTTNTPTTGAMTFYAKYVPLSPDGALVPV